MVGRGVPGDRIPHDDGRSVNRDLIKKRSLPDREFRLQLALLVIVGEGLPHIHVGLENQPLTETAHIGCRDVVELADAGVAAEFQDVAGPFNVRSPGFPGGAGAFERQAGGIVEESAAVLGDPADAPGIESQVGFGDFPLEHHGPGQLPPQVLLPVTHDVLDPLQRRRLAGGPDQHRQPRVGQGEIAQKITSQEPRGPSDQHVVLHDAVQVDPMR
jgi:hypothetical protein